MLCRTCNNFTILDRANSLNCVHKQVISQESSLRVCSELKVMGQAQVMTIRTSIQPVLLQFADLYPHVVALAEEERAAKQAELILLTDEIDRIQSRLSSVEREKVRTYF